MKYKFSPQDEVIIKDNFYYITLNNGIFKLNKEQYVFLNNFAHCNDILSVLSSYPSEYQLNIKKLIDYYIDKKILVPENYVEKNILGLINRFTKFSMPIFLKLRIEKMVYSIEKMMNFRICNLLFLILNIVGTFCIISVIKQTHFVIEHSPRTLFMFLMGFIVAIVHELCIALYITHENVSIRRWYIRIWLGFFISIGTNWANMLTKGRKYVISMFIFAINGTLCFVSLTAIIAKILLNYISTEEIMWLVNFSVGGYIFIIVSIYPFLFKNDGFYLFQEIMQVRKIRTRFFNLLFFPVSKEIRQNWKNNSLKERIIILSWGIGFISTICLVEYFISNGVRIII
ncbi:hypothetical protein LMK19_003007 [Listeria monocytogenes]|nr:hypothetical protein [Listeria monocytogenes]